MEIGLKSACSLGADILGTGMMAARFHCCGVVEVAMDRLKDEWLVYRTLELPTEETTLEDGRVL